MCYRVVGNMHLKANLMRFQCFAVTSFYYHLINAVIITIRSLNFSAPKQQSAPLKI